MQLRSGVAVSVSVAVAGNYSSDETPSLGTSMCHRYGPKKNKKKKKKKKTNKKITLLFVDNINIMQCNIGDYLFMYFKNMLTFLLWNYPRQLCCKPL